MNLRRLLPTLLSIGLLLAGWQVVALSADLPAFGAVKNGAIGFL